MLPYILPNSLTQKQRPPMKNLFFLLFFCPIILLAQGPEIIWEKTYNQEGDITIHDMVNTSMGVVVVGSIQRKNTKDTDGWMIMLGLDGSVLWEKVTLDNRFDYYKSVLFDERDALYILQNANDGAEHEIKIRKWTIDGNQIWEKSYKHDGRFIGNDIQKTEDGSYLIAGSTTKKDGEGIEGLLLKVDKYGNQLWRKSYPNLKEIDDPIISKSQTANALATGLDGSIIMAGFTSSTTIADFWVTKTDEDGRIAWDKSFGSFGGDELKDVFLTYDGKITVAGTRYDQLEGEKYFIELALLDQDSKVLWQQEYDLYGLGRLNKCLYTSAGGYVLAGVAGPVPGGEFENKLNPWVLRINSTGEIIWNLHLEYPEDQEVKSIVELDKGYIIAIQNAGFLSDQSQISFLKF